MENHDPIKSITAGQVSKIYDVLVAALQKSGLPSEPTQQVLEQQGVDLADEFVVALRKRVEAISNMIVRRVAVNRTRSPQEAITVTGRFLYLNDKVVATMPRGESDEADVFFFKPDASVYDKNGNISDDEVAKQFELRGFKPVDPYALAAVNEADPAFADDHSNCTHWKDSDGNWCYVAFDRWRDERVVYVSRSDYDWNGYWWFAGCRK